MSKARLALTIAAVVLLALAAALGAATSWLFYTESGLRWLSARAIGFAGEGLTLDGVSGTLARGARISSIRYAGDDIEVRIHDAALAVSPLSVLALEPHLRGLAAREVAVVTKPGEPRGKPPNTLELPLDFQVSNAHIGRLVVDLGKGPLELTDVRLDYEGGRSDHRVSNLTLNAMGHAIALRGTIDAQAPFPLDAAVTAVRREKPQGAVYATIGGNLTELAIDGGGRSSGARVSGTATLRPYDALPLAAATLQASGIDLQAFNPELPRTAFSGELALKRSGNVLRGPLQLTNALPGPYDQERVPVRSLRATAAANLNAVSFAALEADLGAAGRISGSGDVQPDAAALTLTTDRLNLRGLHSKLRETHLAGRAELTLNKAKQSVVAALEQDDIALKFTAHRAADEVDIPRFQASARGGEATGQAHVTLAGTQPFEVEMTLRRFDPAAWGDFPRGSINGEASARGAIAGREADIQFAIRDSRWLGAPLAGNGSMSVAGERLRRADVQVTLGGNRLSAQGTLGRPTDTLDVRFDAPNLALVDEALRGTLKGTAQLSGDWRAPRVRFDVAGNGLAHQRYGRVDAVAARGVVSSEESGPIDVDATLRGIKSRQYALSTLRIHVDGTRADHAALVQASGDRVDFQARARGGWRAAAGWSGTLRELVNRGEVPVELIAPVAIVASPTRVRAEPFEIHVVGGRLSVSELAYERGRFSSAGRVVDLPVRPVVALAGAPADMAGTLRLSGTWNVRNTPALAGTVSIARASGDVALGADRSVKLGLQTLAVNADFSERGIVFDARVQSALANGVARGRIAPVPGASSAHYSGASPLELAAKVDVARLAPFASFIDTTILIQGEAHADIQSNGTLSDPKLTGVVTADRLAVALPAEGINYHGGTLRAVIEPRAIVLKSFAIRAGDGVLTANGTLARTGFDEASVDWRADRFTALARPDRRLVVSGKGNAALKGGRLSLNGELSANEGTFEIGTTSLPTLGSDVVIVGREPKEPAADARRFKALALDLIVHLGNRVHVLGQGLDVWLSGDVKVFTNARGEIQVSGTVNARNGTFVAYGQRLEIDRGYVYFNGPPTNPGLDIVALRKRQAVEAGVAVTGTLRTPLVRVVSDPPLPQGEALSWLILGRGPDQAGTGELSALPLAAGALFGKASGSIARGLQLDELSLRGSGGDLSGQFVTLGKRISDRVYVVFEQSLTTAENLLRLEWTLTRRVVARVEAGDESSVGLFYRYRWD